METIYLSRNKYNIRIQKIVIATAVLGYTLGYAKLWAFHLIMALSLVLILAGKIKLQKVDIKYLTPFILLIVYSAFSLIYTRDALTGLRYIFYFTCGLMVVINCLTFCKNENDLMSLSKLFSILIIANISIGVLECLEILRLPMSPYSEYAHLFGAKESNLHELENFQIDIVKTKPTGFNANPNNFGFVWILFFPWLFLNKRIYIKAIAIILFIFFNYFIESKSLFVAGIIFFVSYLIINIKKPAITIGSIIFIVIIFYFLLSNKDARYASAFTEISNGLNLIKYSDFSKLNSTGLRAFIYAHGIDLFSKSYGLGIGIGGITSYLESIKFPITSFHFFFLEMLVDLGAIIFSILMFFYITLIVKLFKVTHSNKVDYLAKSIGYSLIIALPASIGPSSIIYILSFWCTLGLGVATLKISKIDSNSYYKIK